MHFAAADEILVAAGGCNAFTAYLKALFDTGLNQFYHRSVVLQFEVLFLHVLLEFSSLADTCTRNKFVNHRGIKKRSAGIQLIAYPAYQAFALPLCRR